ncbi:MAG TPA: glutaminyl-peptide cyclotransferase, partial [Cyclobacteriaceae bacterium]|nr:glutaminyl-peptide cyclotransferase [Cyclobacteriaceae bacterium]
MKFFLLPSVVILFAFCACSGKKSRETVKGAIAYSVKKIFPHDTKSFTQGLTVADGRLFESTGQAGSWIAEVNIATGDHDKKVILNEKYFGEGITAMNNKIYQLTWKNHVGFIYDLKSFVKIG